MAQKKVAVGAQLGLIVIATVFSVLSVALDKWEHLNTRRSAAHVGLWHACRSDECVEIDTDDRSTY